MIKKKIPFFVLTSIVLTTVIILSASASILGVISASLTINEDSYFTIVDDGHTFKCYTIENHTIEVNGDDYPTVAIGWVLNDSNTIPSNLTVPETVSYNDTTYYVAAVAKAGFRYCTFQTISLPDTIEEMKEEAFAYCDKMTSFTIPHQVSEIAPSTFLDCRAMTSVSYKEDDGAGNISLSLGNKVITRIGDHAFDSCVSLSSFNCPDKVTYFGESCFQNCSSLGTFEFPRATKSGNTVTNPLTIKSFAFADCSLLTSCYFEENLVAGSVSSHAFTDCNSDLTFLFTGTQAQINTFDSNNDCWRRKFITTSDSTNIPLTPNSAKRIKDNRYPGLSWVYVTGTVNLDSNNGKATSNGIGVLDSTNERYARITGFVTPTINVPGYYVNGALTIPDELPDPDSGEDATVKVKVIGGSGIKPFDQNTTLTSVTFNESLVQIARQAFWHCTGLTSLDFSHCTHLKEVSYQVFAGNDSSYIPGVTSLVLPNTLEFIGDYGFANFTKVNSLTISNSLRVLGERAFQRLGSTLSAGTVNLVLPNTLNDQDATDANFYHPDHTGTAYAPTAVGRHCFDTANALATVEMEEAEPEQMWVDYNAATPSQLNTSYTCSLGTSTFVRCKNLVRFKASENLWTLGASTFKSEGNNNYAIREIFLTTKKANALSLTSNDYIYPWGINNAKNDALRKIGNDSLNNADPMFIGAAGRPDLVIYVDGDLPGRMGSDDKNERWNVERGAAYVNSFGRSSARSVIPTYTNVAWQEEGGVIYWDPKKNDASQFAAVPDTANDYNNGVIAIVKEKKANPNDNDRYIVSRYYCSNNNAKSEIDLSKIPTGAYGGYTANAISDNLKTIGDEAFAHTGSIKSGEYFILPYSIEKINERSFYRNSTDRGVKIVTYRQTNNNGNIYNGAGTASATIDKSSNYCYLPNTVKLVGRDAFYNNLFASVTISISSTAADGSAGFFMGTSAFHTSVAASSIASFSLTDNRTNKDFETINNGLYYVGQGDSKKILVYQTGGSTGSVAIDNNTVAIGMRAMSNTKFSSVTIPSSVTTIYGSAFQRNASLNATNALTTIVGGSGLEYISATEPNQALYTSIWETGMPFDVTDWWDWKEKKHEHLASAYGAFKDNKFLTTVDFKSMINLKKIGRQAFENCSVLEQMTGSGTTYNYCTYNSSTHAVSSPTSKTSGVLDLSSATNLRSIAYYAFNGCSKIAYVHLPDSTNGNRRLESSLYIGKNPDKHDINSQTATGGHSGDYGVDDDGYVFSNTSTVLLTGETVHQASYIVSSNKDGDVLNSTAHYFNGIIKGDTGNVKFYYRIDYPIARKDSYAVGNKSKYRDLDESAGTAANARYWIKVDDNYILFENYDQAKDFCDNVDSIYDPNNGYVNYLNLQSRVLSFSNRVYKQINRFNNLRNPPILLVTPQGGIFYGN